MERVVTEIRGSEVRCSGSDGSQHEDVIVPVPAGETAHCPVCGRGFRRAGRWNQISGANWPEDS